jgi:hypothetical protein
MSDSTSVPDEFIKVMKDFIKDIHTTFPEYSPFINKWWKNESEYEYIEDLQERKNAIEKGEKISSKIVFDFCKKKMPPRFIDILYQNEDIFKEDSEVDTEFLPHIHFKNLWQFDISENTRETIWKYLQLIVFSIVGTLDNKEVFGDTTKLFEAINQDEFKNKLEETLTKMQEIFDNNGTTSDKGLGSSLNIDDIPKANDIHEHITGMLDGKLGKLAKEIAEETAQSINIDMENATDMKDVLGKLLKNPSKLMNLVQSVGSKLDDKMKSGEIKESELMEEGMDLLNKMKNMPGMGDMQKIFSQMGIPGLGKGTKLNMGAMEAQMNKNMKTAKMKERCRAKAMANAKAKEMQQQSNNVQQNPLVSEEEIIKIFSNGEKSEKTPRGTKPPSENINDVKPKKSKK